MSYETHNPIGFVIHSNLKYFGEIFAFAFLGFIVWLTLFMCFTYWKELCLTYFRHIDNKNLGLYEILKKLKTRYRHMLFFTALVLVLYLTVMKIEESKKIFILQKGWFLFMSLYCFYYGYMYLYLKESFDYFEDFEIGRASCRERVLMPV